MGIEGYDVGGCRVRHRQTASLDITVRELHEKFPAARIDKRRSATLIPA
jgi:hypothetical protein